MIRLTILAALLCVASIPAQGFSFGNMSFRNGSPSVTVVNGEPMLVVIGSTVELRIECWGGPCQQVELELINVQTLAYQRDVGHWWGQHDPNSTNFSGFFPVDRTGINRYSGSHIYRGAPVGLWYAFGTCDQPSASYYPCVMDGQNPLAAMVFRVRLL